MTHNGRAAVLTGAQPGHKLLFANIYEQIRSGVWRPEEQIPGERELCERYGVSRSMVRQALQQAELQGLLVRIPGRGTFVNRPRVQQELRQMTTFQATLAERSMKPGRRVLTCQWQLASEELLAALQLPAAANVLELDTLGLGDGRPMALYQSHLGSPFAERVETAIDRPELAERSIYELATGSDTRGVVVDQTFEVVTLDVSSANLLNVGAGSAAFRVASVFKLADGRPIEHRVALYPGSRYSFHISREVAPA